MYNNKKKYSLSPRSIESPTREDSAYSFSSFSSSENETLMSESLEEYDQNCLLFPTYATKHTYNDDEIPVLTDDWHIRVRGCAFSTPKSSRTRALFLKITSLVNRIPKNDSRYEHLQSRTPLFWASNLDNKEFFVEVVGLTKPNKMSIDGDPNDPENDENFMSEATKNDMENIRQHFHGNTDMGDEKYKISVVSSSGSFSGVITVQRPTIEKWTKEEGVGNMLKLGVYHNEDNRPVFGVVNFIEPKGISVISDIDDTIKETSILAGVKTILQNTFLQPLKDVSGMSALYQYWYDKGAVFHYVSNSPWQLFPMLHNFFAEHNFPPGSAHLKFYELIKKNGHDQKGRSSESKKKHIMELLKDFPERKFILIGDTGERDPELYAEIAEEYSNQIIRVFVRDVNTPHLNSQPDMTGGSYTRAINYINKSFKSVYSGGREQEKELEVVSETSEISFSTDDKRPRSPSNRLNFRSIMNSTITSIRQVVKTPTDEIDNSPYDSETPMETESTTSGDQSFMDSDEDKPMSPKASKIEIFNKRIRDLQERFEEGFFSTFSDPNELRDDPVIKSYFDKKY